MSACTKVKQDAFHAIQKQEAGIAKARQAINSFPSIVPASAKNNARRKLDEAQRQLDVVKRALQC